MKLHAPLFGICLVVTSLPALAQQPQPASGQTPTPQNDAVADRATQTLRCQTEANVDLAISGCSALIQSGSLSDAALASTFARRAALLAQAGDNDKAMKDLDQSLLLAPGTASLFALRGKVAEALKQTDVAINSYEQCVQLDPARSECQGSAALLKAGAQKETGACTDGTDADAVIAACTTLIARADNNPRIFNARGVAYFNKKDYRRALEDFSSSIRLEPQDSVVLTNRCNAYIQIRQYDRAIDDCDDALRAKPNNAQALYARGLAKFDRDDADGAIADFNAALALNPPEPALVQGYRGAAYLKKGDLASAEKDLNEAEHQLPTSAGIRAYLGGLYVEQHQPDKAISELNTALNLNPGLAVALIYRGRAYIQKHQTALGLKDLDAAVKAEPDNAFVFQARGLVYVSLGQAAKAATDFKACRVLDPFAPCGGAKQQAAQPEGAKPVVTTAKPGATVKPVTKTANTQATPPAKAAPAKPAKPLPPKK